MLRGVNVSGQNRLRMPDFSTALASLGFEGVSTYLQSGNAVFVARGSPASIAGSVARMLDERFGLAVPVLVRTAGELASVRAGNPYAAAEEDPAKLLVTFLVDDPGRTGTTVERPPASGRDRFEVVGREVYLHCPGGYGRTKLTNEFFERRLGTTGTTRNWRTVAALADLAAATTGSSPSR